MAKSEPRNRSRQPQFASKRPRPQRSNFASQGYSRRLGTPSGSWSSESDALSRDLRRRGFKFVGSTICYAFMQAAGMVNDHTVDCFRWREIR